MGLWSRIDQFIEEIQERLEIDGEVSLEAAPIPIKSAARFRLGPRAKGKPRRVDVTSILAQEVAVLRQLNRKAWVTFDRLDEAFAEDRAFETRALRALLRATKDLGAEQLQVRTKIFLRRDVLKRVVHDGFVGFTHLRRHDLRWDKDGMIDMLARRIIESPEIADAYELKRQMLNTLSGRIRVCQSVLPVSVLGQETFSWIQECSSDGTNEINPRNVLTLLIEARNAQLRVYERDDPQAHPPPPPLLSEDALQAGYAALSEVRMDDTILAEYSHIRRHVEALRHFPARFSRTQLAAALGMAQDSNRFADAVEQLAECGLVELLADEQLRVPPLYRPALLSTKSLRLDLD
jgi:hypothetical protein